MTHHGADVGTEEEIYFGVKNWATFQQYKDGRPITWIKLHLVLQQDYDFARLPEVTQAHLLRIWLLAGATKNHMPLDPWYVHHTIQAQSYVDLPLLLSEGWLCTENDVSVETALKYLSEHPYESVRDRTPPYESVRSRERAGARGRARREEKRREEMEEVYQPPSLETENAPPRSEDGGGRSLEEIDQTPDPPPMRAKPEVERQDWDAKVAAMKAKEEREATASP